MPLVWPPLVSVIVPVYNGERYLDKCLDSICRQTLGEIEIICVNDGSTDGSAAALSQWAQRDPRIKVITQENRGIGEARNTGLGHGSAPYVGFVDQDDWIEPETYAAAVRPLLDDPAVDLVLWGFRKIFGSSLNQTYVLKQNSVVLPKKKGSVSFSGDERFKTSKLVWNKLFKKSIIEEHQVRFPTSLCEDISFAVKYLAHVRFGFYLPETFYNYYIHQASVSHLGRGRQLQTPPLINAAIPDIFKYYKDQGLWLDHQTFLADLLAHFTSKSYEKAIHTQEVIDKALALAEEYDLPERPYGLFRNLRQGRPPYPYRSKHNWLERIASVKNQGDRKIFCFLGLKLAISRSRLKELTNHFRPRS